MLRFARSSRGDEAERYDGLDVVRVVGNGGCFGVLPFPFDLNVDDVSLDSDAVAAMPFVAMSMKPFDEDCTPRYCR